MNIEITLQDAATVRAILSTHAEMQDNRAIPSMETLARIKRNDSGTEDEQNMIEDLEDQIEDLEDDSINLRRLADLFPGS